MSHKQLTDSLRATLALVTADSYPVAHGQQVIANAHAALAAPVDPIGDALTYCNSRIGERDSGEFFARLAGSLRKAATM